MKNIELLKEYADELYDEVVAIRRHLHQYPEVSFKEFKTTEYIISQLDGLGLDIHRPLETGLVAVLSGDIKSDRVVAIRADIDALGMDEYGEAKEAFKSKNEGAAHCCGHDAHTANLIGAIKILNKLKSQLEGKIVFIFQPGEEKLPGGGRLLTETGILDDLKVQRIFGLHTYPHAKPGQIATRKNELMASPNEFEITFKGKGGHAAAPHRCVDTIVMASTFITSLQTVVSRNVDPTEKAVATVGSFHGGKVHNVIPEKVEILGTIRAFSKETAQLIGDRGRALAEGIAASFGGSCDYSYNPGYPAVVNDETSTDTVLELGTALLGAENVIELERPIMAGEDFAFYQEKYPGCFFYLGTGSEVCESTYDWHHPMYNIDEEAFRTGAAMMAAIGLYA